MSGSVKRNDDGTFTIHESGKGPVTVGQGELHAPASDSIGRAAGILDEPFCISVRDSGRPVCSRSIVTFPVTVGVTCAYYVLRNGGNSGSWESGECHDGLPVCEG
jgi:hypothetical protein